MLFPDVIQAILPGSSGEHWRGALESVSTVETVRQGLNLSALDTLTESTFITQNDTEALIISRGALRYRRKQRRLLTTDESERVLRIIRVIEGADEYFKNPLATERWLRKPNRFLGGASPLGISNTEAGARIIEQHIVAMAHGFCA